MFSLRLEPELRAQVLERGGTRWVRQLLAETLRLEQGAWRSPSVDIIRDGEQARLRIDFRPAGMRMPEAFQAVLRARLAAAQVQPRCRQCGRTRSENSPWEGPWVLEAGQLPLDQVEGLAREAVAMIEQLQLQVGDPPQIRGWPLGASAPERPVGRR